MGLCIEVCCCQDLVIHDDEEADRLIEEIDQHLESIGLNPHSEPKNKPTMSFRVLDYSGLHSLRRLTAYIQFTGDFPHSNS